MRLQPYRGMTLFLFVVSRAINDTYVKTSGWCTWQLAKMSVGPKFIELTAGVSDSVLRTNCG